jgi:isopentenyl-diphosphate delta-isomerase
MPDDLILVDAQNRAIGRAEKWAVHRAGLRHRAFSIFLVDPRGRMLLQQRSRSKYHSAGLWANSCCGHPRPGERTLAAARRRLQEELGASAPLRFAFRASYCTTLPNGLTENEIVYVYFGRTPPVLSPNPEEVAQVVHVPLARLLSDLTQHPRRYAYWLRHYMKKHLRAVREGVAAARADAG